MYSLKIDHMKKLKTYVLIISRYFPKTHLRAGEETKFIENIFWWWKIHTIRENYPLWEKRINEVNKGNAVLSLRYWEGKPRHSKQIEFLQLAKAGIEKLEFIDGDFNCMYVNNKHCFSTIETSIAKNDGLSFDDFKNWFADYDLTKPMAIIHFTDFRYCG